MHRLFNTFILCLLATMFGSVAFSQAPQASATFHLGSQVNPTEIKPGTADALPWIRKGVLPVGSILRSVIPNATLEALIQSDHRANDICYFFDPSPENPDWNPGSLQIGGYWPAGQVHLGFHTGWGSVGATVNETRYDTEWASLGNVDLATHQVFIGNLYNLAASWSGTMTIRYDGAGNDIVSFDLSGQNAVFSGGNNIALTVPYGAPLTNLTPYFQICDGATCTVNGFPVVSGVTPVDFTHPVVYTVTAPDGVSTQAYTVTINTEPASEACDLEAIKINLPGSRVTVMPSGSVVVNVPAGTTNAQLTALSPSLTLSAGATCAVPNPPLSLTAPTQYHVTAQDGVTTKDYTATVVQDAEDFTLFALLTDTSGLTSADYHYLSLVSVSKHQNNGIPAILTLSSPGDFDSDIYLQDYLRRYRPSAIKTVNFSAAVPEFSSSSITAASPLALSVSMATEQWASTNRVVLVSDEISAANYPNVLQASALAAALDAPMLYYNPADAALVENAIAQLGATSVIYVNAAGTKPAVATHLLRNPAAVVNYLASKNIRVDYFAVTNPRDTALISGSKLSLTAPFIAARRNGIVVPIESYVPDTTELFHYTGYSLISAELNDLYQSIGRYPEYLALVGNATSIPLSYNGPNEDTGLFNSAPTDFDYSNVDADVFADIAIGRIMAYNIFDATLLTSRISTYEQLLDGVWENNHAEVGGSWDFPEQGLLAANYGFQRMNFVGNLSPEQRVEAAIISHTDHSTQHVVGGAFSVDSKNILAPCTIFSAGCATAAIDFETLVDGYCSDNVCIPPTDRGEGLLAVNRLFKLGAISYAGATRSDPGSGRMMISGAENALLEGQPLGQCYKAGMDALTLPWDTGSRRNWIMLGDPGLRIHLPAAPAVSPAHHVVNAIDPLTDHLVVQVPDSLFVQQVNLSWCQHWGLTFPTTYWGTKPGLYGMDVDRYYMVRFTPDRPVLSVEALDTFPVFNAWVHGEISLGWIAPPTIDYRQDGKDLLVWTVRANVMDWGNPLGGTVPLAELANATFRINYSTVSGTNEGDEAPNSILLYPNPASQYVDVLFPGQNGNTRPMPEELFVYNAYGACVLHQKNPILISAGHLRINTAQLSSGIYFLKIGNITRKFMVVR